MRGRLFALNDYSFLEGEDAFARAIAALAARVQAEGDPGVLGYRFFGDGTGARAIVTYRDAQAWIGHHDRAFGWPEMAALHAAGRLDRVTLLGQVTPEIRAWIAASPLRAEIRVFDQTLAGFDR